MGERQQVVSHDDKCPICEVILSWDRGVDDIKLRAICCGCTWAHCPENEPFLVSVNSMAEFEKAHEEHGIPDMDKAFSLLPASTD